jgi:hypothetical protein
MLGSLNLSARQRAMIDDAADEVPVAQIERYQKFIADVLRPFREIRDSSVRHAICLAPIPRISYHAFVDPSGGSSDSMTLAIAHKEGERVILDLVREWRPPFSPDGVVSECAEVLKMYGVRTVTGDRYGGEWTREPFIGRGIAYKLSDKNKSDIYRDFLPAINSGRVELLDLPKLVSQLASLERRVARGGKDSIDHPKGLHDDIANSVSGAVQVALGPIQHPVVQTRWGYRSNKPKSHRWDGLLPSGGYATTR